MTMASPPLCRCSVVKVLFRADALAGIIPAKVNERPATHARLRCSFSRSASAAPGGERRLHSESATSISSSAGCTFLRTPSNSASTTPLARPRVAKHGPSPSRFSSLTNCLYFAAIERPATWCSLDVTAATCPDRIVRRMVRGSGQTVPGSGSDPPRSPAHGGEPGSVRRRERSRARTHAWT
jgi:hypothetical protein